MFSLGWFCFFIIVLTLVYMLVKDFAETPRDLWTLAGIGVGLISISYVITKVSR